MRTFKTKTEKTKNKEEEAEAKLREAALAALKSMREGRLGSGKKQNNKDEGNAGYGGDEGNEGGEGVEGNAGEGDAGGVRSQVATLEVRHKESGLWMRFEGCEGGASNTVSRRALHELGVKAQGLEEGDEVRLLVRFSGRGSGQQDVFVLTEEALPSIRWTKEGVWQERAQPRRPEGEKLCDFEAAGWEDIWSADEEWEEAWWTARMEEVRAASVREGEDETGALFETEEVESVAAVLGDWLQRGQLQPEGKEYDYPKMPEDNAEWMATKESVFVAGGMFVQGMEERWRAMGADEEVLGWIRAGGYTVKVSEEGTGLFLKNGKLARDHDGELGKLVLQLLLKGSWEVVQAQQLTNVLPLHLAPKPGKNPPWRLICDGREVNKAVKEWKFRMESLRTLPVVVKPGDLMFTCDLEDAFYSAMLTEESRNLFGAKLKLDADMVQRCDRTGHL